MQPIYKKPTKGNMHQLTVRQHIHSKALIKKFSNNDQRVEVRNIARNELKETTPSDAIFCAYRAWDQVAESSFCSRIEDSYFQEVDKILAYSDRPSDFLTRNHTAITDYYCLWAAREEIGREPQKDTPLNTTKAERTIPEAQRELLEKKGVVTLNAQHEIEARFMNRPRLIRSFDIRKNELRLARWAVVRATGGFELICADSYPNFLYMPISPNTALISNSSVDGAVSLKVIGYLNRISIECSKKFFFARDFSKCPIQKTPSDWPYRIE